MVHTERDLISVPMPCAVSHYLPSYEDEDVLNLNSEGDHFIIPMFKYT